MSLAAVVAAAAAVAGPRAGAEWRQLADSPLSRTEGAVARVGRAVVLGGEEPAGTIREVELLSRNRRWSALPDLPTPRHGLGAVFSGGRVFAISGGDQPGFFFTGRVEALQIRR